jgi:hypothetical protein
MTRVLLIFLSIVCGASGATSPSAANVAALFAAKNVSSVSKAADRIDTDIGSPNGGTRFPFTNVLLSAAALSAAGGDVSLTESALESFIAAIRAFSLSQFQLPPPLLHPPQNKTSPNPPPRKPRSPQPPRPPVPPKPLRPPPKIIPPRLRRILTSASGGLM